MVAHYLGVVGVASSNLAHPTIFYSTKNYKTKKHKNLEDLQLDLKKYVVDKLKLRFIYYIYGFFNIVPGMALILLVKV